VTRIAVFRQRTNLIAFELEEEMVNIIASGFRLSMDRTWSPVPIENLDRDIDYGARRGYVSLRCDRTSASAKSPEHLYPKRDESGPYIESLADVMLIRGVPEHIRSDNGQGFVAQARSLPLNDSL
jgi:hypothetical protein